LLIRVNSFAMRFQRANIVALRVSKMRPMASSGMSAGSAAATRLSHRRGRRASRSSPAALRAWASPATRLADGSDAAGPGRLAGLTRRGGRCYVTPACR
jgi:hypothetical protein